jgi:hypothetical protein
MERGRRNASRTDAAKEKLAALAAVKASGKKRVETYEAKREEAVYDEARAAGAAARSWLAAAGAARRRPGVRAGWSLRMRRAPPGRPASRLNPRELTPCVSVLRRAVRVAARSWTRSRTPTWWPSAAWRRAASWWATRTAGARGAAARAFAREALQLESMARGRAAHVCVLTGGRGARRSYEDIGEEDDWETADRDSEGEEEADGGAAGGEPGKKRKGDGAKARLGCPSRRRAARRGCSFRCTRGLERTRPLPRAAALFSGARVPSRRGAHERPRVCLCAFCAFVRTPQATKAGGGDKKGAAKEAPRYRSDVQKLFAHAQAVQARAVAARALPPSLLRVFACVVRRRRRSLTPLPPPAGRQPAEAQGAHGRGALAPLRHRRARQHRQARTRRSHFHAHARHRKALPHLCHLLRFDAFFARAQHAGRHPGGHRRGADAHARRRRWQRGWRLCDSRRGEPLHARGCRRARNAHAAHGRRVRRRSAAHGRWRRWRRRRAADAGDAQRSASASLLLLCGCASLHRRCRARGRLR